MTSCLRRMMKMLGLAALVLAGCDRQAETPRDIARRELERGPLRFVVEAEPQSPQVGDVVTIRLIVETPPDYEVTFPTTDDFGELDAREGKAPEPRPGATGILRQRVFTLEPPAAGPLGIPALAVKYAHVDSAATQPAFENQLVSEPLTLEVRSALTPEDDPTKPRDITGTLVPPRPPMPLWQRILLAGGVVTAVAVAYAAYRVIRRLRQRPPPLLIPEIWALEALEKLTQGDWFDPQRIRAFYYELTEILRRYVELKFGLTATEMTTEEFLLALARGERSIPYDQYRLQTFLEACDLVKYAALTPRQEDGEAMLSTARAFIHATAAAAEEARRPAIAAVPGGAAPVQTAGPVRSRQGDQP